MITYTQVLYQCNYNDDNPNKPCLIGQGLYAMLISVGFNNANSEMPTAPLSDVTSSRKNQQFFSYISSIIN